MDLTIERVKEIFEYNRDMGEITWRNGPRKGKIAGSMTPNGYAIKIDGKKFYRNRIIWLLENGEIPGHFIRRIDGNPFNDQISNLEIGYRMNKKEKSSIDISRLRKMLHYDENTGYFSWTEKAPQKVRGKKTGYIGTDGYVVIGFQGLIHKAHKLAWMIFYGEEPKGIIDHINKNKSDNSISNLRICNHHESLYNRVMRKDNRSGYKGVTKRKCGKYLARITVKKLRICLGYFERPEDAHKAYCEAAIKYHGDFAEVN